MNEEELKNIVSYKLENSIENNRIGKLTVTMLVDVRKSQEQSKEKQKKTSQIKISMKQDKTQEQLLHIESLLQRMPEMIAAAWMIEKEKVESLRFMGKKYQESVYLCPIEKR